MQISHTDGHAPELPDALTAENAWVYWRWKTRDGDLTKIPYSPKTGEKASVDDPSTWASLDEATSTHSRRDGEGGIGRMLSGNGTLAGIDLDGCVDAGGEIRPEAQEIIDRLDSYTEVSPSGTGIRVFVHAVKPGPRCNTKRLHQ